MKNKDVITILRGHDLYIMHVKCVYLCVIFMYMFIISIKLYKSMDNDTTINGQLNTKNLSKLKIFFLS